MSHLLFLGDSLSQGLYASGDSVSFRHKTAAALGATQEHIAGASGGKSGDFLTQESEITAAAADSDFVIVELGTNDAGASVPASTLEANLRTLAGWCRNGNADCYLAFCSVWSAASAYPDHDDAIAAVAADYGHHLVDFSPLYETAANRGPAALLSPYAGSYQYNRHTNPHLTQDSNSDGRADQVTVDGSTNITGTPTYSVSAAGQRCQYVGAAGDASKRWNVLAWPIASIASLGIVSGDVITYSAYVDPTYAGCTLQLGVQLWTSAWGDAGGSFTALSSGVPGRKSVTRSVGATAANVGFYLFSSNSAIDSGDSLDLTFKDVLIETNSTFSTFFAGDSGTSYDWEGTANASRSRRWVTDAFHPNDAGHAAITAALLSQLGHDGNGPVIGSRIVRGVAA